MARVGIATGLVVVGELVGMGAAQEETVVGETPNLAARLQALAPRGRWWSRPTLGGWSATCSNAPTWASAASRGSQHAVRAWRVLGEGRAESRFEALRAPGLAPLIGRERELELLLGLWARAKDGAGQVVLLAGEPGIGKSRLARALSDALAGEEHMVLRYQCSPYHTGSALWPVVRQFGFAAGLAPGEPAAAKLGKLEALLRQGTEDVSEAAPLAAALLGIDAATLLPA